MFSAKTLVLVFAMLQVSTNVFGDPFRGLQIGLEGWRRTHCAQLRRLSFNVQFPWYCKPGRMWVIYVGFRYGGRDYWFNTRNRFSYTGPVPRSSDVHFITEQDGTGQIIAKFNGVTLKCHGFASYKRKRCIIPAALRPWSGAIILKIFASHVSTRFGMSGRPV